MTRWRKTSASLAGGAIALCAVAAASATTASAQSAPAHQASAAGESRPKPTIVLVAGAFEDSSIWDGEVSALQREGYPVIAPAVPLRGLATDSAYLTSVVRGIKGPVVLVGHSYGGMLITETAASDPSQVKALVYVAALIPKAGESTGELVGSYPGSLLGPDTTYTLDYPGGVETYVRPGSFHALIAGDQSASSAALAAAIQRPIDSDALGEPATAGLPAGIPVYALVAEQDMAIPPAAEQFEAKRAGAEIFSVDAAHDLPVTHPGSVTAVVQRAAR